MSVICVPDGDFAAALGDVDDLEVLVWSGEGPEPAGLERVELLVARYQLVPWDPALLRRMSALKVIQVLTAGVEKWLDLVPAGVTLCNGRGLHGGSTAELAIGAIISHLRQLPRFAAAQARHEWDSEYTEGLRGRRVLVLGAGDIGDRVAAIARILDAEVTVVARRARVGVHTLDELASLLPKAQVVVIALPNTPATTGVVDGAFLAALPDGALVVNVARGLLLVTDALVAELRAQRLSAFLDVFEVEPLPPDHPLWSLPNAVLTPHVGGGAAGWELVAYRLVRDQLARLRCGEPLANVVTAGY